MIVFVAAGLIVTLLSIFFLGYGWVNEQQFLFGPFIAGLIGINYLFIAYLRYKQEKEEGSI
ncbi:hypothetical protein [Bacillus sp. FJAT-45037]|uniref:hypothetical protein n=1 Tax=Bacillus sp. FJAT-45037 TaxID=2011007 RepID=UPI000C2353F0|nr:hypothetical protein [Bacillus sp. FJAT-45037]